jgi:quercetin dioxygenase-like cupin family protein
MAYKYYPKPLERIVFSPEGAQPEVLFAEGQVKIIVVGLKPGQKIPVHPEGLSTFHFLDGKGVMIVDGDRLAVGPGAVIIVEDGVSRGIEAETQLKFLAVGITELEH